LDSVIATGMAKDPDQRYSKTTELARAARSAISSGVPKAATPRDPQGTVAGVAPSVPTEVRPHENADAAGAPTQVRPTEDVDEAWAQTQARPPEATDEAWTPTQAGPPEHVKKAWAPTEAGTPEHVEKAWASTQAHPDKDLREAPPPNGELPDQGSGTGPAPWPWWQRKVIVIPAAAIVTVAALVTIVFAVAGNKPPARPSGPLDATFAVEFGAQTKPNGQPYDNASGGSETWVIKSACRSGACVATASKVSGSQSTASTLVLDEIDGKWTSVSSTPGTCQNAPTEFWETMSLQSQPDGSLHGEFTVRSTTGCARNQQVTFTRTGDVERNVSIADPEAQPPRVASAEGLRGRYQETDTYTDGGRTAEVNFDIQTYCLRTGQRCLSYWLNPDDAKILVFSQNQWVLTTTSADSTCKSGGAAHREITLQYPLPQPPQNPITLLTGRGHYTISGACPFNSDFDSRVERTGD
jgi:serine/threonine-protein kinase